MAGIGFELNRYLHKDSYFSLIKAYGYAGIVSAASWVFSILGILLLCIFCYMSGLSYEELKKFQIVVVYLISSSLILTAFLQYSFNRYIADQYFLKKYQYIAPNFNSILLLILAISFVVSMVLINVIFPTSPLSFKIVLNSCFIILSLVWVSASVMSGLKAYKIILSGFFCAYLLTVIIGFKLNSYGVEGLLTGFLYGQLFLLLILTYCIYYFYPSHVLIRYDFFGRDKVHSSLFFTGLLYTIGVWADKYIFWYSPTTTSPGFGLLQTSTVYDIPIFFAYLGIIPGMAVFFLQMETSYIRAYKHFYREVCGGGTLAQIEVAQYDLQFATRQAIYSVMKTQAMVLLFALTVGPSIFHLIHVSTVYLPLFYINVVAAGLNAVFMGLLDILFYMNRLNQVLILAAIFMISNIIFTLYTIHLGYLYFGYGLAFSLLLVIIMSFIFLNAAFSKLQYETFMLQ